jgi:hypothetical protein
VDDTKIIDAIAGCIMATKIPHNPKTLPEKIICDADTYHFGTEDFIHTDSWLKKELRSGINFPIDNWDRSTLDMLIKHEYITSYCRELLNKGKQKNIAIAIKRIQGINRSNLYKILKVFADVLKHLHEKLFTIEHCDLHFKINFSTES